MYHLAQGNKFTAIKIEPCATLTQARERCAWWSGLGLGYIAIPVRAGRVEAVKEARPPGWGKIQAHKVLVVRKSRDHINARRRELGRLRKLGLAPPVRRRTK